MDGAALQCLLAMSPEEFEGAIARWLTAIGWRCRTTKRTGDQGVDVLAVNPDALTGGLYVVQCKRYGPDNLVGSPALREFLGTIVHHGAARGLFITTSSFTKEARDFAEGKPIALIDGRALVAHLAEAGLADGESAAVTVPGSGTAESDLLPLASGLAESDPIRAAAICADLIRSKPKSSGAWRLLGSIRSEQGRSLEALECWSRALDCAEGRRERYCLSYIIAMEYLLSPDLPDRKAFHHLMNCLKEMPFERPSWPRYRLFQYWVERGDSHCAAGHLVLGRFLDALEPKDARIFQESGLPKDCLDRVRAAGRDAVKRGGSMLEQGDWGRALHEFRVAVEGMPEDRQAWRGLGYASTQAGDYQSAFDAYRVYLDAWPEVDDADEVTEHLVALADRVEH